ncbi:uncharacterized protein LOC121370355 [Gigantopelta aegis]|uniref:uncharacterized protein LOC121370355 n=1 Tax=Gigantopelta aegis TaxID=1735272 RepID=UPI001B88A0DB|nr:uncharacterized protein LOC121370355 [Gigantopelta aegis]
MKPSVILVYLTILVCHADSFGVLRGFPGFSIGMRQRGFGFQFRPFLFQRPHQNRGRCEDPCKNMEAACESQGKICRIVQVNCFIPPCVPVAQCVRNPVRVDSFNPCRYNGPVLSTSYREYASCHFLGLSCPTGTRCVPYNGGSKCCYAPAGCKAAAEAAPAKPVVLPPTSNRFCPAPNLLTCRRQNCQREQDCPVGYFCCTTSCGTRSCSLSPRLRRPSNDLAAMFREKPRGIPAGPPVSVGSRFGLKSSLFAGPRGGGFSLPGLHSIDRGTCPPMMSIKTCRSDMCQTDADCYLGKCCISRCGKRVCTAGKGRISFFG